MNTFDLAIAWNWEGDRDFVHIIEQECNKRGISTYQITNDNLQFVLKKLSSGMISFHVFYDRASDADDDFLHLVNKLNNPKILTINPHHYLPHAIDKASMHLEFITNGINVPYTIILPPFSEKNDIDINGEDFENLGKPFVIKPANTTGGGTGVFLNALSIKDVKEIRKQHPDDKYLLQEKIYPKILDGMRGWFRVYYAFGEIISCWWDDITHMYKPLSSEEKEMYSLFSLNDISQTIRNICKLDFFSSEIVFTQDAKFVVVDYVNEICDMRLQSKFPNGAPDVIVHRIAQLISKTIESHIQRLDIQTND